jgi:hypothetical protein
MSLPAGVCIDPPRPGKEFQGFACMMAAMIVAAESAAKKILHHGIPPGPPWESGDPPHLAHPVRCPLCRMVYGASPVSQSRRGA